MKLDATAVSVVVTCPRCTWRALVLTRAEGWTVAAAHAARVHGITDGTAARQARRTTR